MTAKSFPAEILRPGSPAESAFLISEIQHRAKLDQNESPVDIPQDVKLAIAHSLVEEDWNRYPQPRAYQEVKERFAAAIGQHPERVIITAGADQVILLAFWAAGGAGRRARIFEPTYPMYAAFGRFTQTETDRVVLGPEFHLSAAGLGDQVDLLTLVSPNNPTGNSIDPSVVEEALGRPCLVLMDEAYGDYAGETHEHLIEDHPNLLIARSLSKAQLAGVRLGYGVGHPDLINVMERLIFAPYHLNALQLATAAHYDLVRPRVMEEVERTVLERERIQRELAGLGLRVYPSLGNFVMFEVSDAGAVNKGLLDRGMRIRDVSGMPGMGEHLRVTVGTSAENDLFLKAVAESL